MSMTAPAKRIEDALSVVATWISKNKKIEVVYHDKDGAWANIEEGKIFIPQLGSVSHETLQLLRTFVYHESGHIAYTKNNFETPKGSKFTILNSLEDVRMERVLSKKYEGCKEVLKWGRGYFNKKISEQVSSGETEDAPLWEALCYMSFLADTIQPAWNPTEKAQAYIDIAYPIYMKVREAKSTKDCSDITDEIWDALAEEIQNQQEEQDQNQQQQQQQQGNGGEGEDSQPSNSEPSNSESSNGEDGENSESSNGEDGENGKDNNDADGEENSNGSSNGEETEDDSENGSEGGSSGESGEDDTSDADGEESGSEGDSGDNTDSSNTDNSKAEPSQGKEEYNDDAKGQKSSGKKLTPEDIEAMLDKESQGKELSDVIAEEIGKNLSNMNSVDKGYKPFRTFDEHNVPEISNRTIEKFMEQKRKVSTEINGMSRALDQILRTRAKSRKQPNQEFGKIDNRKLTQIAKGLSKQVFQKTKKGQVLDTVVSIVIDESWSMTDCYMEIQNLAIALGETLNKIGVKFEIVGATTKFDGSHYGNGSTYKPLEQGSLKYSRTNPIVYNHYKGYSEQWSKVRSRVTQTGYHNHHIDGEVVEYATAGILQRKESRKIIFSLSDGQPYGGQDNTGKLQRHLVRACEKARMAGVEVYGWGINTRDPERFYGKENFIYLDANEGMGKVFFRNLAKIVLG